MATDGEQLSLEVTFTGSGSAPSPIKPTMELYPHEQMLSGSVSFLEDVLEKWKVGRFGTHSHIAENSAMMSGTALPEYFDSTSAATTHVLSDFSRKDEYASSEGSADTAVNAQEPQTTRRADFPEVSVAASEDTCASHLSTASDDSSLTVYIPIPASISSMENNVGKGEVGNGVSSIEPKRPLRTDHASILLDTGYSRCSAGISAPPEEQAKPFLFGHSSLADCHESKSGNSILHSEQGVSGSRLCDVVASHAGTNVSSAYRTPTRRHRHPDMQAWAAAHHHTLENLRDALTACQTPTQSTARSPAHNRTPVGLQSVEHAEGTPGIMLTIRPNLSGVTTGSPNKGRPSFLLDSMNGQQLTPDRNRSRDGGSFLVSCDHHTRHSRSSSEGMPTSYPCNTTSEVAHTTVYSVTEPANRYHVPGADRAYTERRELQQRLHRMEAERKEMAECTFHPVISPGTIALVERQHCGESGTHSGERSGVQRRTEPFYDRLYPRSLAAAAERRQKDGEGAEVKRVMRAELHKIRARCGALYQSNEPGKSGVFGTFLSNVLQADCRRKSTETLLADSIVIKSTYLSPTAVALRGERSTPRGTMRGMSGKRPAVIPIVRTDDSDESMLSTTEESARRATQFNEFLHRQNAHYFNRARTVRDLETSLTPNFTPAVNPASTVMLQQMIERSVQDSSSAPDTSSILHRTIAAQVPVGEVVVTKHKSSYTDPCTFQPKISALAKKTQPRSFDTLFAYSKRFERSKAAAKERAEKDAISGLSFKPQLLTHKNVHVKSLLDPQNYGRYEQYLKSKRLQAEQRKMEQDDERARQEMAKCTFSPKTTKKPAYISKMASSFATLQQLQSR